MFTYCSATLRYGMLYELKRTIGVLLMKVLIRFWVSFAIAAALFVTMVPLAQAGPDTCNAGSHCSGTI